MELERAGYTTVVQAFDFRPGADFVHEMQQATASAARTIAVVSPAYFGSRFAESEWRVAFAKDPSGERGMLLPVRVQPCEPPGLLATRVFVDLVDVDEAEARERLLTAVGPVGPRPTSAPFPGGRTADGSGGGCAVSRGGADGDEPGTRGTGPSPAVTRRWLGCTRGCTARTPVAVAVLPVEAVYVSYSRRYSASVRALTVPARASSQASANFPNGSRRASRPTKRPSAPL